MTDQDFKAASGIALDEFLDHQKRRVSEPYWFPLHASSIGRKTVWKVLARRLNMMDRASLGHIPENMQNFVWQRLQDIQKDMQALQESGENARTITEAHANNEQSIRAANIYCHAAFVDPRIVLEQGQENVPERKLFVDRIAVEDRLAFLLACNDADGEQARLFETFRPGSAPDVRDREAEPVAPTSIRPAGDAAIHYQPGDMP